MDKPEADALFRQATDLQQAGKLAEARAIHEQVLAAMPGYPHVPHLLGVIVAQQGDLHLARRLMESALFMHGQDADVLANLAWVLYQMSLPAAALERSDESLALEPSQLRACLTRGMSLRSLGRPEEALESFDRALALRPGLAEALNHRGQCLHTLRRFDEARQAYEAALQSQADLADAHNNLGSTLTLLDRHDEARESFARALQLRPQFPEALLNLGISLQAAEQYDEALRFYEAALQLRPDFAEALCYRAIAMQRLRRMPQACLASLDRAIELRPTYLDALNVRANVLAELEQYEAALRDYDRALAISPRHHETHLNRGNALRGMGRFDEAADAFRESMRLGGDADSGLYALAAMGRGTAPPAAPVEYVVTLFDKYAAKFDSHLLGRLKYQAHEKLCEAVVALAASGANDIVDLGCGTGLCAPLLQPLARSMTGVDLSQKMLEAARERNIYTRLVRADVAAFLDVSEARSVDIIVSTDVFIYIGDLTAVFAGAKKVLRPGGLFGFSVEAGEDEDFVLRPSRRYAQSEAYVRRLAADNGFEIVRFEPLVLRQEHGQDLAGNIVVLRGQ